MFILPHFSHKFNHRTFFFRWSPRPLFVVDGEEATVKQIKKSEDGMTLIGWNPAVYPPKFYTWAEVEKLPVQILGLVKEVRGKIT